MDILIQNATMVLPETTVIGDLLIADGIISQIQPGGGIEANENTRTIDATGLHHEIRLAGNFAEQTILYCFSRRQQFACLERQRMSVDMYPLFIYFPCHRHCDFAARKVGLEYSSATTALVLCRLPPDVV